jgi:hypothetical protein
MIKQLFPYRMDLGHFGPLRYKPSRFSIVQFIMEKGPSSSLLRLLTGPYPKCELCKQQNTLALEHESVFLSVSVSASWPFGNHGAFVHTSASLRTKGRGLRNQKPAPVLSTFQVSFRAEAADRSLRV